MIQEKHIDAPPGYSLFGWSPETIKQQFASKLLCVGDPMIVYNAHGGLHRYILALVVNPAAGPQKRVVLSKAGHSGGTSFHRSGLNAFMPKERPLCCRPSRH